MDDATRRRMPLAHVLIAVTVIAAGLAIADRGFAKTPGGGIDTATDCFSEFEGVSTNPVTCADGDPSCDTDTTSGQCTFRISICLNQTETGCTLEPLSKVKLKPKKLFQITGDLTSTECGAYSGTATIVAKLRGKQHNKPSKKKKVRVVAKGSSGAKDKDVLVLQCVVGGTTTTTTRPGDGICPPNSAGATEPNTIVLVVKEAGTDLDNGWKGPSFNFPTPKNTTVAICLNDCNDGTGASPDPECVSNIPTGEGTFNRTTFGPPLPLFAAGVPVCVVNEYQPSQATLTGVANLQTGTVDGEVRLFSKVYLTEEENVCPKCNNGRCGSGPRQGQACTVDGTVTVSESTAANKEFNLSKDCPPPSGAPAGTLDIRLPLTTGTSTLSPLPGGSAATPCVKQPGEQTGVTPQPDLCPAGGTCGANCGGTQTCKTMGTDPVTNNPVCIDAKGGISQYCCSNDSSRACQPTRAGNPVGNITRTGKAEPPVDASSMGYGAGTYPKTSTLVNVATFCEAATGTPSVDGLTGLPGPGALILPNAATWSKPQ